MPHGHDADELQHVRRIGAYCIGRNSTIFFPGPRMRILTFNVHLISDQSKGTGESMLWVLPVTLLIFHVTRKSDLGLVVGKCIS